MCISQNLAIFSYKTAIYKFSKNKKNAVSLCIVSSRLEWQEAVQENTMALFWETSQGGEWRNEIENDTC